MKLLDDYTTILSKAKYEAKHGKGLKILTPKQMWSIVNSSCTKKAGNTSESLLNEIRQIIHFLYLAKEFTKKVYNNKINSIKL